MEGKGGRRKRRREKRERKKRRNEGRERREGEEKGGAFSQHIASANYLLHLLHVSSIICKRETIYQVALSFDVSNTSRKHARRCKNKGSVTVPFL